MAETRKDVEYRIGVEDGKNGGFLEDITVGLNPFLSISDPYRLGYEYGSKNRYDENGERYSDKD